MATLQFQTRVPKQDLRERLRNLGAILAGRRSDPHGIGRAFRAFLTQACFELWQKSYRQKAAGGPGLDGRHWKPLSPRTLATPTFPKRKGILRVTDRLYKSLTPGVVVNGDYYKGNQDQSVTMQATKLTLGTSVPYATKHNKGTGRIPARPFLTPDVVQEAKRLAMFRLVRWMNQRNILP